MARFLKVDTIRTICSTRIVPVFYNDDADTACNVMRACYEGGVRAFEFTNRGDFAHEVFASLVRYAARECPEMVLGAGSVVDAPTAVLYMQLGADFIVGPCFNPYVAKVCNRRQVPYIPGCGTVTEIGNAHEAGCEICKVFPAGEVGGPSFVRSVLAPMPWSLLMATGGVEPTGESLQAWFSAGVTAVGMGSKLFPAGAVRDGRWEEITALCSAVMNFK